MQITHPVTKDYYRFWLSDPLISRPVKEDAGAGQDNRLFPWECRETVCLDLADAGSVPIQAWKPIFRKCGTYRVYTNSILYQHSRSHSMSRFPNRPDVPVLGVLAAAAAQGHWPSIPLLSLRVQHFKDPSLSSL